jgi:NTE family protein
MGNLARNRVGIACQGGGSHTAFTSGVLQELFHALPKDVEVVVLSGTSGGAICAALAWDGLVHGDSQRAIHKLARFWESIAASEPWDQMLNESLMTLMSLRDCMTLPEVSPYHLPTWGENRFRAILEDHFDFEELRRLARRPGAPALQIGAVEVLTGRFELFSGEDLCVECLMASAAIPDLFRAVRVPGRGVYWDGLFSQNPPIHELTDYNINELWVIQINSSTCARVPTETHEIFDRRNELAGNLSMEQELKLIEMINRAIAAGAVKNPKMHPISVTRIQLDRDLGYRSKLDRRPDFLEELTDYGRAKAQMFLKERDRKTYTSRSLGLIASDAAAV